MVKKRREKWIAFPESTITRLMAYLGRQEYHEVAQVIATMSQNNRVMDREPKKAASPVTASGAAGSL